MTSLYQETEIEKLVELMLCVGVPFQNDDWTKYPHEQDVMLKAFKNTQGFKDAKSLLMSRLKKEAQDAQLGLLGALGQATDDGTDTTLLIPWMKLVREEIKKGL